MTDEPLIPVSDEDAVLARMEATGAEYEEHISTVAGGRLYAYAHSSDARIPSDIARGMREGVEPPKMLLEGWLVEGEQHLLYAAAEAFKTWIALYLSIEVMHTGRTVVYFDEELGDAVIVERLKALGADEDLIAKRFVHFGFPGWTASAADQESHHTLLRSVGTDLGLVVYDTVTDMLSQVGADENSGGDYTAWVKAYPEKARQLGAAQLLLDHIGHSVRDRSVGTRAKLAKAKVQYLVELTRPGDRETVGQVKVTRKKNTRGALIDAERTFDIGGGHGETGGFVFLEREVAGPSAADSAQARKARRQLEMRDDFVRILREHEGRRFTTTQILGMVPGGQTEKHRTLAALASETYSGVKQAPGEGSQILYWWEEPARDSEPD